LQYALPVWWSTYKSNVQKLLTLQNKAVKHIANGQWNDSPNPFYKELNILIIEQIFKLEVAKIMHRIYFKQQLQTITQYLKKSSIVHCYSTRSSTFHMFSIPLFRTSKFQLIFLYQGVNIWNSIPNEIKTQPFPKFKSSVKHCFISSQ